MDKRLINLFKDGNIVIPLYLLQRYKEFSVSLDEFVFLMYLYHKGNSIPFDPRQISQELGISVQEVMEKISVLSDKHFIDVQVFKNDKNISMEVISLDSFYEKVSLMMMDSINHQDHADESSCFDFIQKEFGRTLSPMEIEIVKAWISDGNSDELIMEAVREAVFNGVHNFRYIDKILFEWGKKGIKTKDDVLKAKKTRKSREEEEEKELFDYNWFEDDE